MKHLQEFFAMGGYAKFVWPAYGLALAVLLKNIMTSYRFKCRALHQLTSKRDHS